MTAHGTRAWAVATAGCSPKQLDRWTRKGWLRAGNLGVGNGIVTGNRWWTPSEVSIAGLMVRLIDDGLVPAVAAKVARRVVEERLSLANHTVGHDGGVQVEIKLSDATALLVTI